jgi:2-iminobutanoate/2-iminopropanoate deaminase
MKIAHRLLLFLLPALFFLASCAPMIPEKRVVVTESAPSSIGSSSQAVVAGNSLYISGQIGVEPLRGQLVPGGILAETQQALSNIDALLKVAGYTKRDVVRMEVYLTNMNDYQTVQSIFDNYFTSVPPVVNYVEINRLPRGAMVSLVATATK